MYILNNNDKYHCKNSITNFVMKYKTYNKLQLAKDDAFYIINFKFDMSTAFILYFVTSVGKRQLFIHQFTAH